MRPRRKIVIVVLVLITIIVGYRVSQRFSKRDTSVDLQQATSVHTLEHAGRTREYIVHVPASYDGISSWPVVLAFHGGGGTNTSFIRETNLNTTADRYGFIVVYPLGTGIQLRGKTLGTWNTGKCCGYAKENNVDDVGFVAALIDQLQKDFSIDTKKIFATGYSNGALMSYRLACELSDKIAAIAPVAGHDSLNSCNWTRPVPIIHFHGTSDPTFIYEGGICGGLFNKIYNLPNQEDSTWACPSVTRYIRDWASHNQCVLNSQVTLQKNAATCQSYTSCAEGADITLCSLQGAGHTWPGGEYASDSKSFKEGVGAINYDISANELMWEFFAKHSLP